MTTKTVTDGYALIRPVNVPKRAWTEIHSEVIFAEIISKTCIFSLHLDRERIKGSVKKKIVAFQDLGLN